MAKRRLILRSYSVVLGALCHIAFAWAVWEMFWGIETGFSENLQHSHPVKGILANFALVMQFPLVHSFLLSSKGRKLLEAISFDKRLTTTMFALISSLQLAAFFKLWSPTGVNVYTLSQEFKSVFEVIYICSWVLLARTMMDAGLSYQTGALGWWAVFKNKQPKYPSMPSKGTFRFVRQPIYLAFFLILWSSPSGSLDRLFFAAVWGIYLLIAPVLKERRFKHFFGEQFGRYQKATPYFFPRLRNK